MSPIYEETETSENTVESDDSNIVPQAGEFCYEDAAQNVTQTQVMGFVDQNPSYVCEIASDPDPTMTSVANADCTLGEFMSRPVKIATYSWPVGTPNGINQLLYPWTAFLRNRRVVNRLTTFRNVRGNLHVKFLVNGNNFYYGRMLVSYLPFGAFGSGNFGNARPLGPLTPPIDTVAATCRPHIYLDPSTSQGGEMVLPFFYPQDSLSTPDLTDQILNSLGLLWLTSLTPMFHTNGGTTAVTVTVYAWMTDVYMYGPTETNTSILVPQSGTEYGTGVISKPMSVLSRFASAMKDAPIIGPYAMATSLAASATGQIASLFGFSRPRILTDPAPMVPTLCGNMANYNANDTSISLALDAKQEITIDPRVTGLSSADELFIHHIASKESLMGRVQWDVGTAEGAILHTNFVTPCFYRQSGSGPTTEIALSSCGFAAFPFSYWRGTVKFRFQIVASGYHKGRMKIVFDPWTTSFATEDNTAYTRIVDLAEERDFEVDCAWQNNRPSCSVAYFSNFGPGTLGAQPSFTNGTLSLYVLNELVGPSATTNPIYINVFISCPDLMLWSPTSERLNTLSYYPLNVTPALALDTVKEEENTDDLEPQSGVVESDENTAGDPSIPNNPSTTLVMGEDSNSDQLIAVLAGERVSSIRQLLKRYCLHTFYGFYCGPDQEKMSEIIHPRMPWYRGSAPNSFDVVGPLNNIGFNKCKTTFYNFYRPAFAGHRGSVRWKYCRSFTGSPTTTSNNFNGQEMSMIERKADDARYVQQEWIIEPPPSNTGGPYMNRIRDWAEIAPHGGDGLAASGVVNPNLEIELPWYSQSRFARYANPNFSENTPQAEGLKFTTFLPQQTSVGFTSYVAVGEDFNMMFYHGPPIHYRYRAPFL
jgi:hypothetical protein